MHRFSKGAYIAPGTYYKGGEVVRYSNDEYKDGRLMNGYDYDNQAWVLDGKYVACGHRASMNCSCYGRIHKGEETKKG
jgi:hypothetical protein